MVVLIIIKVWESDLGLPRVKWGALIGFHGLIRDTQGSPAIWQLYKTFMVKTSLS